MKKIKSFKIRFADNLRQSMVTIEGRTVRVHALNGTVILDALPEDDIQGLRNRVYDLVKGTPCNVEAVNGLLELCL